MFKTIKLCLKEKALSLSLLLFIIWPMAFTYQRKVQIMEIILKTAQSRPADQHVTIYYNLTQIIINQEHNMVKAAKNAMIEIEKDSELKESLGNKE